MARATWNGAIIAESDDIELVDGNVYFPAAAVNKEHLQPSQLHTVCGWKGDCSYYDVVVAGKINRDAAWYYANPKPAAASIRGRIAFWNGVDVQR